MSVGLDPTLLGASAQTGLDVQNKLHMDSLARTLNAGNTDEKKLREACRGFESAFLQKLMAQMRATVPKDGLLHGPYEDKYLSMFDQALGDKLAEAGGIGLADMMFSQLKARVGRGKGQSGEAGATPDTAAAVSPGTVLPANRPVAGQGLGLDRLPVASSGASQRPERIVHDPVVAHPSHSLFLSSREAQGADPARSGREQAATELAAPVSGVITSDYGWRGDPFTGRTAWHAGMDIAAPEGEAVAACWDGQVVFAGQKGGYGNAVIVEHQGGWRSVYGHLRSIDVRQGDVVAAGRKIAEVGSTGRSTGPHLHFELRYAGASVDPMQVGVYAANAASPGANAGTARQTRHNGGGSHDLENHRQPGEAGEGPGAFEHASGGRIYPPEGA
ncbi:MAG: peptidoglycan DD-metalloendopeptidase family protein [Desulfovibrionaceae bacterium]|nr:peptidoglycan DD-metalloendopeptidase family protein [Desulfovibrionaceae bacterium]